MSRSLPCQQECNGTPHHSWTVESRTYFWRTSVAVEAKDLMVQVLVEHEPSPRNHDPLIPAPWTLTTHYCWYQNVAVTSSRLAVMSSDLVSSSPALDNISSCHCSAYTASTRPPSFLKSVVPSPTISNSLPMTLRLTDNYQQFRRLLKTHLFNLAFN